MVASVGGDCGGMVPGVDQREVVRAHRRETGSALVGERSYRDGVNHGSSLKVNRGSGRGSNSGRAGSVVRPLVGNSGVAYREEENLDGMRETNVVRRSSVLSGVEGLTRSSLDLLDEHVARSATHTPALVRRDNCVVGPDLASPKNWGSSDIGRSGSVGDTSCVVLKNQELIPIAEGKVDAHVVVGEGRSGKSTATVASEEEGKGKVTSKGWKGSSRSNICGSRIAVRNRGQLSNVTNHVQVAVGLASGSGKGRPEVQVIVVETGSDKVVKGQGALLDQVVHQVAGPTNLTSGSGALVASRQSNGGEGNAKPDAKKVVARAGNAHRPLLPKGSVTSRAGKRNWDLGKPGGLANFAYKVGSGIVATIHVLFKFIKGGKINKARSDVRRAVGHLFIYVKKINKNKKLCYDPKNSSENQFKVLRYNKFECLKTCAQCQMSTPLQPVDILEIDARIKDGFRKDDALLDQYRENLRELELTKTRNFPPRVKNDLEISIVILREKISRIVSKTDYNIYIAKTARIISEYKQVLAKPVKISFVKKIVYENDEKVALVNEYLKISQEYETLTTDTVSNQKKDVEIKCEICGNTQHFDVDEDYYICESCGLQKDHNQNTASYKDSDRINVVSKYTYDRKVHFRDCINQYQGKQNCTINPAVYTDLEAEFEKYGLLVPDAEGEARFSKITKDTILMFLKNLGYAKHYENVNLIHYNLTGIKPDDISHLEEALLADFDLVVEMYDKMFKNKINRTNFINTQNLLYQLLLKHKHPCKRSDFVLLKTVERRNTYDSISGELFQALGWSKFELYG